MNKEIVPVVCGVVHQNGKFLLTKRAEWDVEDYQNLRGTPWQIPGGGLEFGESIKDCLHRELKEETGLDLKIVKLLPKIFHEVRGNWHGIFICFLCKMLNPKQPVILNSEASEYDWYALAEIKKLPCLPLTYEIALLASSHK